jgi:Ca2+-binding EF-hand superfamily protein
MTHIAKLNIAVAGLAAVAGLTFAGQALAGKPPAHAAAAEWKAMDTDGDGKLSPEEHADAARRMFEVMDANQDGKVTAAEMDAAQKQVLGKKAKRGGMSSAEKIEAIDTDGDGELTAAEHEAGARTMFEKMDADHDGFVTRDELTEGHARLMQPRSK